MIANKNQQLLVGGALVFKDSRGKRQFLVVKQKDDGDWEIPKVNVRRGESSVRAVIRMTSEQAGMSARVLEEAGRTASTAIINGKNIPQKFLYYLMEQKAGGVEVVGFNDFKWLEYGEAVKKISLKREKDIIRSGKDVLKEWEKTHDRRLQ